MDIFLDELQIEIGREKALMEHNAKILSESPQGFLNIKQRRNNHYSYYWTYHEGCGNQRKQRQVNINKNFDMIARLTRKKLSSIIWDNCYKNLPKLEKLRAQIKPVSIDAVLKKCPEKYQEAFRLLSKAQMEELMVTPYSKCPNNPQYHKHTTDYGERVRSKSEQILANTLYAYGIPFHYEEEFFYSVGNIGRIYPDFTIFLPSGDIIIWEHLGMLSIEQYCINNARKLNIYQQNGFTIGDNLILTMDDNNGNFSSTIINKTIRNEILPKLRGIQINKNISSQGIK